jgi:hypothetical protein
MISAKEKSRESERCSGGRSNRSAVDSTICENVLRCVVRSSMTVALILSMRQEAVCKDSLRSSVKNRYTACARIE